MLPPEIRIIGVPGLPEIEAGQSLPDVIADGIRQSAIGVCHGDIFVIAQKIVSKAENRTIALDSVNPSPLALHWAQSHGKDPRLVELVLQQSRRIVRMDRGHLIVENHLGLVCANAGIDTSNVAEGYVTLLPEDCNCSARNLCRSLENEFGTRLAVVIADTFGRPWREGLVNVAVGVAAMDPLLDYRGMVDQSGRRLNVTIINLADELASAAELVMGKTLAIPVALIRGVTYTPAEDQGERMIREADRDLFR